MPAEACSPAATQEWVNTGSDVVIIPYSSYRVNGVVEPSIFTRMAADAAALLYKQSVYPDTNLIVPGERPYCDEPSTTDVVAEYLQRSKPNMAQVCFYDKQPQKANGTPQQIAWLNKQFGKRWRETGAASPVFVVHEQHLARVALLRDLFRLPAGLVDASAILDGAGTLDDEYRRARDLHEKNEPYEARAMRLTKLLAPLGAGVTTLAFQALVAVRSPTVLGVKDGDLYASTRREHDRTERRNAVRDEPQLV